MAAIENILSGPFQDVNGDREYRVQDFRDMQRMMISDGVYIGTFKDYGANSFLVTINAENTTEIKITKGIGLLRGVKYELIEDTVVTLPTDDGVTYKIVARVSDEANARKTVIDYKTGDLVNNENIDEMLLATVSVDIEGVYPVLTVTDERTYMTSRGFLPAYVPNGNIPDLIWKGAVFPEELTPEEQASIDGNSNYQDMIGEANTGALGFNEGLIEITVPNNESGVIVTATKGKESISVVTNNKGKAVIKTSVGTYSVLIVSGNSFYATEITTLGGQKTKVEVHSEDYVSDFIYGMSINLSNSNPLNCVTYTDDASNLGAAWENMPLIKDIKPCVMLNGVVQYYLNKKDLTKKEDGTAAVLTGADGDVMIEIPKIWYYISKTGTTLNIKISNRQVDSNYCCRAHLRGSTEKDVCYIGRYLGYTSDSKLKSRSGVYPTDSQTLGTFRSQAQANGLGYQLMTFNQVTLLQCLYILRFGNLNSQEALGLGYTSGSAKTVTGGSNTRGFMSGDPSNALQQISFFGIEDFWGNLYQMIDGAFANSSFNILNCTGSYSDTGAGGTSGSTGVSANLSGYISDVVGNNICGFTVKTASGSSSTYFSDRGSLGASRLPYFGGYYSNGAYAGVFYLYFDMDATASRAYYGARLAFC